MQKETYLQQCLNKNRIVRWQNALMPLRIYVAPFNWYKNKNQYESYKYKQMVIDALKTWENASSGAVSFVVVDKLHDSQINLEWKRVDRKSLGQCHFHYDQFGRFYSAEVQIGLSDGIIHRQYMDENEVYHTILHEIGHALGLGHSPNSGDIMFVPHQYGVINLTAGDVKTIKWLYKFEIGKSESEILSLHSSAKVTNIDDLIAVLSGSKSKFEQVKEQVSQRENRDLIQENTNIADLKKYLLELNKIKIELREPDKN